MDKDRVIAVARAIMNAEEVGTWDDTSDEAWDYETLEVHGYVKQAVAALKVADQTK